MSAIHNFKFRLGHSVMDAVSGNGWLHSSDKVLMKFVNVISSFLNSIRFASAYTLYANVYIFYI